ncbi:MAG: integrase arm-type DNA-binding domain-containing protein, partial [Hyphomicrobiales bacterium]|nr:integrase arm-type DNA-binding domain-containing protein [Hyphomicrobiales bacterium]
MAKATGLTDMAIRAIPLPAKGQIERRDLEYNGAGGLYLTIGHTGAATWSFRYTRARKLRKFKIGRYPATTIKMARAMARDLGVEVEKGGDPQADRLRAKYASTAPTPAVRTVAMVAEEFLRRHTDERNGERWAQEVRRILAKEILPVIGAKPIAEVAKADIRDLIDKIADGDGKRAPAPIQANRVLAVCAKMCRWCLGRDYLAVDPTAGLPRPSAETKRGRVLSDDELARVWRAAEGLGYPFGAAAKLLILTGGRREEIAAMKWSEIGTAKWKDAEVPALLLSAARAKNRLEHITPLSPAAAAVLASVPRHGEFVFTTNGKAHIAGWSRAKLRIDRMSGTTGWVFHDFRRCVSTWLNENGTDPHIVEAVLGHVVKGVGGVYNKAGYLREKAEALNLWAKHV